MIVVVMIATITTRRRRKADVNQQGECDTISIVIAYHLDVDVNNGDDGDTKAVLVVAEVGVTQTGWLEVNQEHQSSVFCGWSDVSIHWRSIVTSKK